MLRVPLKAIRASLDLLDRRERLLLIVAAVIQMSLGVLDLIGIALVGLIAAVAVSGMNAATLPPLAQEWIDRLGLGELTSTQLAGMIGLVAVIALVSKTIISAYMSRRIIGFLARQQATVSARLARDFLSRPLLDVQRYSTAEVLYCVSPGVSAAIVGILGAVVGAAAEIFLFLIVAITLFLIDPLLTILVIVLFGGIIAFLQIWLGHRSARNARIMASSSIGLMTSVQE
ncbi:MAG: hypothetical protein ACKOW5_04140, partial [Actinomycetales bacterium]